MENFTAFKAAAELKVRVFLGDFYFLEEKQIGFDYSVWFLPNHLIVFDMKNQEEGAFTNNFAKFKIYESAENERSFEGFTYFFEHKLYEESYANFFELYDIDEDEFEALSITEKMEVVKEVDGETMEEYNFLAREKKLNKIMEQINWTDIEEWYHANQ